MEPHGNASQIKAQKLDTILSYVEIGLWVGLITFDLLSSLLN